MFEPKNTSSLSLEEKIQLLMDERDIRNVIDRLSRAASRADLELYKTCFHDDAVIRNGPTFDGKVSDFFEKFADTAWQVGEVAQYYMTNVLIDLDGDSAHAETQAFSPKTLHQRADNGDRVILMAGFRYLHRFARRNGEWRISVAWFVTDWSFFHNVSAGTKISCSIVEPADQTLAPFPSLRNKDDLSYRFSNL
jgi:hypothetical protein